MPTPENQKLTEYLEKEIEEIYEAFKFQLNLINIKYSEDILSKGSLLDYYIEYANKSDRIKSMYLTVIKLMASIADKQKEIIKLLK